MKILLLNQAFFPDSVSTSQHITDLARELQGHGHDITVVCSRRDYTDRARLYPRFEIAYGIEVHRVPSTWFGKGNFVTRAIDAATYDLMSLWRIVRLPRHDLVIAFTSPPLVGLHGMLAARLWKARFVYWLMNINHEMAVEMGVLKRRSLINRMLTAFYRATLRGGRPRRGHGSLHEGAGGTRAGHRSREDRDRSALACPDINGRRTGRRRPAEPVATEARA